MLGRSTSGMTTLKIGTQKAHAMHENQESKIGTALKL
jgi:hypothetical protein